MCVLALACLSACSPDESAHLLDKTRMTEPTANVPRGAPNAAGAWAQTDAFSPDVQEAARFAAQTFAVQNKARVLLKEISQARQQVVAGRNCEFHLHVTRDGASRNAVAQVWHQLNGQYSLQSWVWVD